MVFTDSQIDAIREGALKILSEIGVCVPCDGSREILAARGFDVSGQWVRIGRQRALGQMQIRPEKHAPRGDEKVKCSVSAYAHMLESIQGAHEPITAARHRELAQFVTKAAAQWPFLQPSAPGHPTDVANHTQFFYQTVHSYMYCPDSDGAGPMDLRTAPYCFEAAEIVGRPITSAHVYVASPLQIAGVSFDIVIAMKDRLSSVTVTNMPCLGANTPLNLVAAYAQALAETLGGAIVVSELTGIRTYYFPQLFPMDFRAMTMSFGTPEKLFLEWTNEEVVARITEDPFYIRSTDIHVMAHRSGEQSILEKGMLAAAGAMRGARHFHTAGSLGMDEVFSPVQMLMDLDMLSCLQKIIDGIPVEDFEEDIVQTVREGLSGGYLRSDYTLDNMNRYISYPQFMTRKSLPALLRDKENTMRERALQKASELLRSPAIWSLREDKSRALTELLERLIKSEG